MMFIHAGTPAQLMLSVLAAALIVAGLALLMAA